MLAQASSGWRPIGTQDSLPREENFQAPVQGCPVLWWGFDLLGTISWMRSPIALQLLPAGQTRELTGPPVDQGSPAHPGQCLWFQALIPWQWGSSGPRGAPATEAVEMGRVSCMLQGHGVGEPLAGAQEPLMASSVGARMQVRKGVTVRAGTFQLLGVGGERDLQDQSLS